MLDIEELGAGVSVAAISNPEEGISACLLAFIRYEDGAFDETVELISGPLSEFIQIPVEEWITNARFIYRWWERELLRAVAFKKEKIVKNIREAIAVGSVYRNASLRLEIKTREKIDRRFNIVFVYERDDDGEKGRIELRYRGVCLCEIVIEGPYYLSWLKKIIGDYIYHGDTRRAKDFVLSGFFDPFFERNNSITEIFTWYISRGYPAILTACNDFSRMSYPIRIILC